MAHLHRSMAALRIFGDDLVPDEVSTMLGAQPDDSESKGEARTLPSGRVRVAKTGYWSLKATTADPEDLDGQVAEFFGRLADDPAVWKEFRLRFDMDLFCGFFMASSNEGVEISARTLRALGRRGIRLGLDIYAPDDP